MVTNKIGRLSPMMRDWAASRGAILRGLILGFVIGVLPGGGGVMSSLASYALEKRRSLYPERFGKGAAEGIAGPETANNAPSASAFAPLLTLGIPSDRASPAGAVLRAARSADVRGNHPAVGFCRLPISSIVA
ncbi:tripartite tricarboxylate transporter permease [Saccharopolyspora hattusasensis]|uniref:tripartite tricarboxylate transporter permease n=1 Tax=Saccharopolyspora hattusasensis TaxID=1128679 RepID=UPI003D99AAEF